MPGQRGRWRILGGELGDQRLRGAACLERRLGQAPVLEVEPRAQQQLLARLGARPAPAQDRRQLLIGLEHPPAAAAWVLPGRQRVRVVPGAVDQLRPAPVSEAHHRGVLARDIAGVRVEGRDPVCADRAVDVHERSLDLVAALLLARAAPVQPLARRARVGERIRRDHGHPRDRDRLGLGGARRQAPGPAAPEARPAGRLRRREHEHGHILSRRPAFEVAAVRRPEREREVELTEPEQLPGRCRGRFTRPGGRCSSAAGSRACA